MAELRCPNCGKSNPDNLEVCQFCQTPLKPESTLHIGQTPTKKNTGELENVLPDWLKNVRQQARDSAEADAAAQAASRSKPQKNEPPDLLAGLASQSSGADEEEVPDWLARLNPSAPSSSPPAAPVTDSDTDFFAQFNQRESQTGSEPPQPESPTSTNMGNQSSPAERDELSDWFARTAESPEETIEFDENAQQNEVGWARNLDSPSTSAESASPQEEEDLSWLRNLEEAARQTGNLQTPKQENDWQANFDLPSTPSQPSGSQEDLSWLDTLGGIEEPPQPGSELPSTSRDDLSWLDQLGGIPQSSQPFEVSQEKASASGDLSWLDNLGAAPEAPQSAQPAAQEDLSWLNALGTESEPLSTQPFSEPVEKATTPRQTAPLGRGTEKAADEEPDWLKRAIEPPSMPAPGDLSMDWFTGTGQPAEEKPVPATSQPAAPESAFFSSSSQPPALSNQEVDSLFSAEMPDWLSRPEAGTEGTTSQERDIPSAPGDESLAPVDLPSWVQAMRPVEAFISETRPGAADQPTETEGPLAGLQGVIPIAPIGSARKPKAVSLKLQASDEQQAGAALLEEILGTETSPRALITPSFVAPQQWLRWALTGLFLLVLSAVIFLRSQFIPISASLPVSRIDSLSNAMINVPAGANVLVVVDYEPSLAGEMEAVSGPVLDQLARLSHPNYSFIATSPNGAALTERLISKTNITQAGAQPLNLGYLPGGATGVLGFIQSPNQVNPLATVQSFSEYSALILLSDHAESGRVWVEQLQNRKQIDPTLANQPLLMVASAQAGPLLQPYVLSGQITGMISGISDAAKYETKNNIPAGIARSYWDTFGIGLMMAVALIVIGSLWSLFTGLRTRRVDAKQG